MKSVARAFQSLEAAGLGLLGVAVDRGWGMAFVSAGLPGVWDANNVLAGRVPAGMTAEGVLGEADGVYLPGRWAYWALDVTAGEGETMPLREALLGRGMVVDRVLLMRRRAGGAVGEGVGAGAAGAEAGGGALGEAGFVVADAEGHWGAYEEMVRRECADWGDAVSQAVERRQMLRGAAGWRTLVAVDGGEVIGSAASFRVGHVGRIDDVYTLPGHRRRGVARAIVGRLLGDEDVGEWLLATGVENLAAQGLYGSLGFEAAGYWETIRRPECTLAE